jgi:IS4 transposase
LRKIEERILFCPLVTPAKQGVELGRVLATDALSSRLQLTEWFERDTKAFSSHGWSTRYKILIPENKNK